MNDEPETYDPAKCFFPLGCPGCANCDPLRPLSGLQTPPTLDRQTRVRAHHFEEALLGLE